MWCSLRRAARKRAQLLATLKSDKRRVVSRQSDFEDPIVREQGNPPIDVMRVEHVGVLSKLLSYQLPVGESIHDV